MTLLSRSAIALILLFTISMPAWSAELTGLWEEYNDDTGNVDALIRIKKLSDNTYEGTIEKILPDSVENSKLTCTHCQGGLRNQPLLGLRILSGMKRKDTENYAGGEVLDPDDGETYSCHIRLSADGNSIEVTGYLSLYLIGQSEIWRRAKNIEPNKSASVKAMP
jgi:uncharacterized protein (DUF2147 family)